jgi:hypothetical protein
LAHRTGLTRQRQTVLRAPSAAWLAHEQGHGVDSCWGRSMQLLLGPRIHLLLLSSMLLLLLSRMLRHQL